MAPPGTKLAIHIKPEVRKSWGAHAKIGFYIGPALEHYHNFKCYLPETRSVVNTDTVITWYPHQPFLPQFTNDDLLQKSILDILHILKTKSKRLTPNTMLGDPVSSDIQKIAKLLQRHVPSLSTKVTTPKQVQPRIPIDPPEEKSFNMHNHPSIIL